MSLESRIVLEDLLGIFDHRPELQKVMHAAIGANVVAPMKDGPAILPFDEDANDGQERQRYSAAGQTNENVEHVFHGALRGARPSRW